MGQAKSPRASTSGHAAARRVGWQPGPVYFLTLLDPRGTTGLWPLPPGRPAVLTVSAPRPGVGSLTLVTAHAARTAAVPGANEVPQLPGVPFHKALRRARARHAASTDSASAPGSRSSCLLRGRKARMIGLGRLPHSTCLLRVHDIH